VSNNINDIDGVILDARERSGEAADRDVQDLTETDVRRMNAVLLQQVRLLLEVVDAIYYPEPVPGSEQDRLRLGLLAEVPESQRAAEGRDRDDAAAAASLLAAIPGDLAVTVTRWLRAARELGIEVQS
jgi:hypothetical protein